MNTTHEKTYKFYPPFLEPLRVGRRGILLEVSHLPGTTYEFDTFDTYAYGRFPREVENTAFGGDRRLVVALGPAVVCGDGYHARLVGDEENSDA